MTPAGVARISARGIELKVRLTPKSSADRVDGVCETADGPAVSARVRALPSEGEANDALVRLIADWLDIAKSSVSLAAGQKSRVKTVLIRMDAGVSLDRLEALLTDASIRTTKR